MLRADTPSTGPAASAAVFVAGLQDEQAALTAFTTLLQAEQDALVEGDTDRLGAIAADKAAQIALLTHLGEQRNRHLAEQELSGSADGMLAWMGRNPGFAAAVKKIWRELLAQAEKARQINDNIGMLIERRLQHTRVQLAVLQSAAAAVGVYRADGQLRPQQGARLLGLG